MLSSIAFVRNWHGFGLGRLRSEMEHALKSTASPEDRLLRFLQSRVRRRRFL